MAVRVVFRRQAQTDVESIADYLARTSPRKAVEISDLLRMRCLSLGEFPERAPAYRDDVRRMAFGAYLIFYRIADPEVEDLRRVIIVRVLRGEQDIDRLVDPEDD